MKVKNIDADTAVGGPTGGTAAADVRVSSPVATGGAGTVFEHHVGAYWLAQLLVSGIPPILIDTTVSEVSFQTERLGWNDLPAFFGPAITGKRRRSDRLVVRGALPDQREPAWPASAPRHLVQLSGSL